MMVAEIMATEKQAMKPENTETKTTESKTAETKSFWTENSEANYVWLCVLPQLKQSFYQVSLKRGTQIIGWIFMFITFWITFMCAGSMFLTWAGAMDSRSYREDRIVWQLMTVAMFAPAVWVSYLLLRGVEQKKPEMIRPFVVLLFVYTALNMFVWLAMIETGFRRMEIDPAVPVFIFAFSAYSLLVVNSYHRQLQSEISASKPQIEV